MERETVKASELTDIHAVVTINDDKLVADLTKQAEAIRELGQALAAFDQQMKRERKNYPDMWRTWKWIRRRVSIRGKRSI